jgi:hypothetical protein
MADLSVSNAALAQQLSTLATNWNANQDQFANWLAGTLTGGAGADGTGVGGYYSLTNAAGVIAYFACPLQIAQTAANSAAANPASIDWSALTAQQGDAILAQFINGSSKATRQTLFNLMQGDQLFAEFQST